MRGDCRPGPLALTPRQSVGCSCCGRLDFSSAMLAIARQRADELELSIDLKEGDATSLDMPDAKFDTVVCTFGLCALPDHEAALAEMVRVLSPPGG